jgi:hypothetical protein
LFRARACRPQVAHSIRLGGPRLAQVRPRPIAAPLGTKKPWGVRQLTDNRWGVWLLSASMSTPAILPNPTASTRYGILTAAQEEAKNRRIPVRDVVARWTAAGQSNPDSAGALSYLARQTRQEVLEGSTSALDVGRSRGVGDPTGEALRIAEFIRQFRVDGDAPKSLEDFTSAANGIAVFRTVINDSETLTRKSSGNINLRFGSDDWKEQMYALGSKKGARNDFDLAFQAEAFSALELGPLVLKELASMAKDSPRAPDLERRRYVEQLAVAMRLRDARPAETATRPSSKAQPHVNLSLSETPRESAPNLCLEKAGPRRNPLPPEGRRTVLFQPEGPFIKRIDRDSVTAVDLPAAIRSFMGLRTQGEYLKILVAIFEDVAFCATHPEDPRVASAWPQWVDATAGRAANVPLFQWRNWVDDGNLKEATRSQEPFLLYVLACMMESTNNQVVFESKAIIESAARLDVAIAPPDGRGAASGNRLMVKIPTLNEYFGGPVRPGGGPRHRWEGKYQHGFPPPTQRRFLEFLVRIASAAEGVEGGDLFALRARTMADALARDVENEPGAGILTPYRIER